MRMLKDEVVQSSVEEVSIEKEVREHSRKKEATLESIFASSPNAITINDLNGNILDCNQATLDMHGFSSKEEVIGKSALELIAKKDHQRAMENLKKALEQGSMKSVEYTLLTKDRREFPAELSASVIKDSSGEPTGFVAITRDITERKQAEEKIKKASEEWEKTFDAITDFVFTVNKDYRLVRVNRALCDILKKEPKELTGKHCFEVMHGTDKPWPNCPHKKMLTTKKTTTEEINDPNLGIPLLVTDSPIFDDAGEIICSVHLAKDITERKKIEEALEESEKKYRTLYETTKDGIVATDIDGRIVECNQAYADMLGYIKNELKKITYDQLTPEQWRQEEDKIVKEQIMKRGYSDEYEKEYIRKDGTAFPISIRVWVIREEDGKPEGMWGIIRDITERKQMEKKLREYSEHLEELVKTRTDELLESDTRYAILVEEAIEGVVIVQDQEIIFANKKFMEMVGYPINELVGLSLEQFVEKLVDKRYRKLLSEIYTRKNGEDKVQPTYEFELMSKNGEHIPVEITATVVCFENRNEMLILLRDIRERKQAEEQRLNLERLAAIGEIASMVGHDLRNPLSGIAGATYYLKKKLNTETPSKTREMLDIIEKNIEYSDRIVNDLLDYSKQIRLSRREVAPKSIIQESVLLARVPKNIEVSDLTQNEPKINIDSDMMKRVFITIIKNAADAMPNGGKLTMKSKESGDNVEIAFSDNGVGIPKEIVEKLFTPLFTTKAKGMGLGLAICKRIVEAHGGHIRVESTVNEGTTFTVIVPITAEVGGGEKIWMSKSESLSPTMMKA